MDTNILSINEKNLSTGQSVAGPNVSTRKNTHERAYKFHKIFACVKSYVYTFKFCLLETNSCHTVKLIFPGRILSARKYSSRYTRPSQVHRNEKGLACVCDI